MTSPRWGKNTWPPDWEPGPLAGGFFFRPGAEGFAFKLLGASTPALTRWERVLVYFGLKRDPRKPYTHTVTTNLTISWLETFPELWGSWEWVE